VIPRAMLVAAFAFSGTLSAPRVVSAIGWGLKDGGLEEPDLCPLDLEGENPPQLRELLAALDFDARMRRARAVVLAAGRLEERTLIGSPTFEIASRARQAGVPTYAITGENALDPFDARILDLQAILQASSPGTLRAAGRQLARLAYGPAPARH
jgi:glycerate kinase